MSSAVASTKGRTISGSLAEWSTRNKAHNKLIKASTKRVHDLYGLLRVWPKAGNVAIRDAYHQIVLEAGAHGPDDLATVAYSILAHPLKRAEYDRDRLHYLYAMTSRDAAEGEMSFHRGADCLSSLMDYADKLAARVAQQQQADADADAKKNKNNHSNDKSHQAQPKSAITAPAAGQRKPVRNNVGNTFEEDDLYIGNDDGDGDGDGDGDDHHRHHHHKLRRSDKAVALSRARATGTASTHRANNTSTEADTATKGSFTNNKKTVTAPTTNNGSPFGDRNEEELMANRSNGNAHKGLVSKQLPHLAAAAAAAKKKKKNNKTVKVGSSASAVVAAKVESVAHDTTTTPTTPNRATTPIAVELDDQEDKNENDKDSTPSPRTFLAQFPPLTMNGLALSDFAKFPPEETDLFNMDEATTALALSIATSPTRTAEESLATTGATATAATTPAVSTPGVSTPTYMQPEGSNGSSSHSRNQSQSQSSVHAVNTSEVDNGSRRITWQEPPWSSPPKLHRTPKSGNIVTDAPDLRIRTPVPAAVTTKATSNFDGDDNDDGDGSEGGGDNGRVWPQFKRPNRPWRTSAPNEARALAKALAAASDKATKGSATSNGRGNRDGGGGHSRNHFLELTADDSQSLTEHAADGHGYSHVHGFSPRAAPIDEFHNAGNVHADQQQQKQHPAVAPRQEPMIHMPVPIRAPTPVGFMPLLPPRQAAHHKGPAPPAPVPHTTRSSSTAAHHGDDSMDRKDAIRDLEILAWTHAQIALAGGFTVGSSSAKVDKQKKNKTDKQKLPEQTNEAVVGNGDTQPDYPSTPARASTARLDEEDEAKVVDEFFRLLKYEPSR